MERVLFFLVLSFLFCVKAYAVKNFNSFLKAIDDAKASIKTCLTLSEVDFISKSISNINFDKQ